jgi:hypothetical protein
VAAAVPRRRDRRLEGVEDDDDHVGNDQPVVYVVEGDHPESTPYAPRELWDLVRS